MVVGCLEEINCRPFKKIREATLVARPGNVDEVDLVIVTCNSWYPTMDEPFQQAGIKMVPASFFPLVVDITFLSTGRTNPYFLGRIHQIEINFLLVYF